tara:strand:- start:232 stop:573 length:342 start_codon:yes stop_codon:yes gene_type:complete
MRNTEHIKHHVDIEGKATTLSICGWTYSIDHSTDEPSLLKWKTKHQGRRDKPWFEAKWSKFSEEYIDELKAFASKIKAISPDIHEAFQDQGLRQIFGLKPLTTHQITNETSNK